MKEDIFTVLDTKTGKEADETEIALREEWAKGLCYCDMEGFFVGADGTMILCDECGRFAYVPEGRFKVSLKPKTGHWIKDTYQSAHCSNCGQIQRTNGQDTTKNCNIHYALYPYCPKCGTKMIKEGE